MLEVEAERLGFFDERPAFVARAESPIPEVIARCHFEPETARRHEDLLGDLCPHGSGRDAGQ